MHATNASAEPGNAASARAQQSTPIEGTGAAAIGRGALLWVGLALVAAALARELPHGTSGGGARELAALGALACAIGCATSRDLATSSSPRSASTWLRACGIAAWCGVAVLLGELALRGAVLAQARVPFAADLLAPLVGALLPAGVAPNGELLVTSPDGSLRFAMTVQTLGLVPLLGFYCGGVALLYVRGAPPWHAARLALLVAGAGLARTALAIVRFADVDRVLASPGPSHTELLQRPDELLACLVLVAACLALFDGAPRASRVVAVSESAAAAVRSPRRAALGFVAALSAALALACAVCAPAATQPKQGRVLLDDRLSDAWAPAARRLDRGWYGDFSTYSLSSLVELSGYAYTFDVGAARAYTRELLADYDVLVLKVPALDLAPHERAAILAWVREGGGLWLIGDHTDLLGSSTRLNELCAEAGIEFRSDSVMDASSGGFSRYTRSALWSHADMRAVDELEFMTSCSLALHGAAEPLIAVPDQVRQDHDYGQSSHFGALHSDPRMDHGLLVLAATAPLGRGRIAAFSDSTVLSSFAAFEPGREELWMSTLAHLDRALVPSAWTRSVAALLACAGGALALLALAGAPRVAVCASLGAAGASACALLAALVAWPSAPAQPAWREAPPRLAIWRANTEAIYPPVLGTPDGIDLASSYDTFVAAVCRSAVFPRAVLELDDGLRERALLVLNPRSPLSADEQRKLVAYVERGGRLVVANKYSHHHLDALQSLLAPFDIGIGAELERGAWHFQLRGAETRPCTTPRMHVAAKRVGEGSVHIVLGAEWWSRESLGHCFDVPGADRRAAYDLVGRLLEDELGIAPRERRTYGILD